MSRVQAATGASADEMAKLRQAAEDAGANTKYTSTEAAAALENLAKAGLSAGDAVATLPAVLNLAQAGDIGLADASEYVTKAVMGMGLAFSDAGRVADVLAMGANATNTSVSGLAQALSYAAPIAQSAGVSLEGTVAIMGKLADAGIDASRSGTAVANMLAQFQDPASAFKMALADAGITTNNFEEALKQLAASGGKGEKAILAVGLNAGPALRALLNQGMGALDELKKKLEGSAGSAAAAAKVMQDNLAGSMKGLGSAWDTVKNVLGTPVLPVLKDAVDQLAGAFRNAVADGTVQKFGESIATTFQAGIKWVRDFVGTVDFTAVLARLQEFADSANKRFAEVGAYATTAGGVVKLAYGVMSAGINGVLTGIYGMGIVFAETAAGIIRASAYLSESLAKIGFGEAKQRLIKEAAEMRIAVAGLEGVSEEFGKKAAAALNATAQSAQTARNGMVGLGGATREAAGAATAGTAAQAALNKELADGAEAAAKAGVAYQKKVQADQEAKQASDEHSAAIANLKAEYAALIASGNLQGAAEKLGEINSKLRDTPDAGKAAADALKALSAAFQTLGVTSTETLKNQAAEAKAAYETIRDAGTSSAEDIAAAFKAAADKAIAANNGIAPSWVEAQAATRGYKVEVDAAGKASLKA
ncbi:MAG: phage tail tape measure protein, partial [Giesbergeria sp.]